MAELAELEEMELESARKRSQLERQATLDLSTPKDAIKRGKSSTTLPSSASTQSLSISSASGSSSSKPGFKDDHIYIYIHTSNPNP